TPGGVRLDRFEPALERETAPTLLYSGALDEPRKGVAVLLEAVAALAEREPDVQLWLSGPGDARSLLDRAPVEARPRTAVLPGDPSSLADACAAALRLAREPGVAGRCRAAAEPYDWQTRLAARLESLYAGDGVAA